MDFPKTYFYDEVREGFYINGMVKREWAAQMETLSEIARVCKKYDIKWFADCGTMLGAVRHGGYVPWDDDLDICMLRDDYQRFHRYAVPELPKGYITLTYENEEYWQMITRVTNRNSISYEEEDLIKYHQFPYAAGVDIFVLDYVAPDAKEEEVRRQLVNTVIEIASISGLDSDNPPQIGLELIQLVEEQCNVKLDRKHHLRRQLYQLAERLSSLYPSDGAREVVLMPYWCSDHNHKYPISYLMDVVQIPFENMMINVPAGYDGALKIEYGDYLRINRKGGLHDYPLYEMQEDFLLEKLENGNPFHYTFDRHDLEYEKEAPPKALKEQLLEYCGALHKLHAAILTVYKEQPDLVANMLIQSQEGAISIGNRIEEQEGERFDTVSRIEQYCEELYECMMALEGDEATYIRRVEALEDALTNVEQSAIQNMRMRREIVFLPFRPDLWSGFDSIYRALKSDPDNLIRVMPLPFYDRDAHGGLGELHYYTEGYPKDLVLTDYRDYDIRQHHPDVIYTQNAYDKCNRTYMLPPSFFTSELKKHTEQLIYVPHFKIGDFDWDDEKLLKTTEYFVKIPGLSHADKTLVESAQMKELYVKVLTEFAGENTRSTWEEKIEVQEMIDTEEKTVLYEEFPDEWRQFLFDANGNKRKAVLFLNAVCSLYQYKDTSLRKLREVLKIFYESRDDIVLIWRPQPALRGASNLFEQALWQEYTEIVEEYRREGWGILDETSDPECSIALADAYYGDPDPVMNKCRLAGKPVMVADFNMCN